MVLEPGNFVPIETRSSSWLSDFVQGEVLSFLYGYERDLANPETRGRLGELYRDSSVLDYEGKRFQGVESIMGRLTTLPQYELQEYTFDLQPSRPDSDMHPYGPNYDKYPFGPDSMFVVQTGTIKAVGESHHLDFSRMFHLKRNPETSKLYIQNEFFRLLFG